MSVYKIDYDYEGFYSFIIKNTELGTKMPKYSPRFRAKPRLQDWVAPEASFYASDNYGGEGEQLPDITTWLTGNLVFNQKSYDFFVDLLSNSGEFLPTLVKGEKAYIYNTLKIIDDSAIDTKKAIDVIDSGVYRGKENIYFDESLLNDSIVFKTNNDHLLNSYCVDEFVRIYSDNGLKGLIFTQLEVK